MKKEKRRIQEQLRRIKRNQEREKQVTNKQVCISFLFLQRNIFLLEKSSKIKILLNKFITLRHILGIFLVIVDPNVLRTNTNLFGCFYVS